jgi:hypothetical protein
MKERNKYRKEATDFFNKDLQATKKSKIDA